MTKNGFCSIFFFFYTFKINPMKWKIKIIAETICHSRKQYVRRQQLIQKNMSGTQHSIRRQWLIIAEKSKHA